MDEKLMPSKYFFLKSIVYHSRSETRENSFRYPLLNFFCPVELWPEFQITLRKKFFRLLSVDSRSYLNRRPEDLSVQISGFIEKNFQEKFDQIVLQSIPKMGGYVFNPISFWYCYRQDLLKAVLCEVNNTFGEKHYYWLSQKGEDLLGKWIEADKQFHVSPFFKIEGKYRFRFIQNEKHIFSEIDYLNRDGTLKLKTWINGQVTPFENLGLKSVLFEYAWLTPLVMLRIHYQAVKLFFKRVSFISKPEKPKQEINHESSLFID